ncbi:uncharacterized protein DDB_G0286299-like [Leguminivora glycinivorella]|uniref:uncharacterized protein DDB_G0286299-like n=1 Tax=Leguminivora glycinivorella TaxID=1035111 RepID=UPI00200C506B|nr:uncharacterized protein DDB_G0286299-like [Leguminivora glycinivorella]
MRCLLIFGSLFIISATYCLPSPCECEREPEPGPVNPKDEPPVVQPPTDKYPDGTRTEILSHVSRNSSQLKSSSKTKSSEKVKIKKKKDGSTVTIIIDKSKTKNKTKGISDSFDQTNHTLIEGGVEEQDSLTKEKQQRVREVSVAKNITKQIIVRNPDGTIRYEKVKSKTSAKDKKSVRSKESESLVRTKKTMTTGSTEEPCVTVTVPPTPPPCESTTTSTTEPPTTTTTEPPRLPCGCLRTTTTTDKPETWPCGHPKPTED